MFIDWGGAMDMANIKTLGVSVPED